MEVIRSTEAFVGEDATGFDLGPRLRISPEYSSQHTPDTDFLYTVSERVHEKAQICQGWKNGPFASEDTRRGCSNGAKASLKN